MILLSKILIKKMLTPYLMKIYPDKLFYGKDLFVKTGEIFIPEILINTRFYKNKCMFNK